MDRAVREQLELDIAAIGRDCPAPHARSAPVPQPESVDEVPVPPEPFSQWLRAQVSRGDWIDDLAKAARSDPSFPKRADPDAVRGYFSNKGIGDPDVFEQVDDAERVWLSL